MCRIASELPPTVVAREKQKTEIRAVAIMFARLERSRVQNCEIHPIIAFRRARLATLGEDPHQSRQEAVAPMRPSWTIADPLAVLRAKWIHLRMLLRQFAHLLLRKGESLGELVAGVV